MVVIDTRVSARVVTEEAITVFIFILRVPMVVEKVLLLVIPDGRLCLRFGSL